MPANNPSIDVAEIAEILNLGSATFSEDELKSFFEHPVWLIIRQNILCEMSGVMTKIANEELTHEKFLFLQAKLSILSKLMQTRDTLTAGSKAATYYAKEQGVENFNHQKDEKRMSRLRELLNHSGRYLWKLV